MSLDHQELLRLGRNIDWQMTRHHENHSFSLCSQGCNSLTQAQIVTRFVTLKIRHHELSKYTKLIENRHRKLRQLCEGKSMKVRILCWKSDIVFHMGGRLCTQNITNPLQVDLKNKTFKEEDKLSYD